MRAPAPQRTRILLALALAAVATLGAVELARTLPHDPLREAKLAAVHRMQAGAEALRAERVRLGLPLDAEADPLGTGLIGAAYTDLTSSLGFLPSKRTSTNAAWAAVIVELLDRAGVRAGDAVAVNFSGSFPALNLAVLAALDALEVRGVIVSSVGASSHGANEPGWTWLDMERLLRERGLTTQRSEAVALGGVVDQAGGLDGDGLVLARAAIDRSGAEFLADGGRATLAADVAQRLAFFEAHARGRPAAFINVGGALVALGEAPHTGTRAFPSGLTLRVRPDTRAIAADDDRTGLLGRMNERGVPVIHLLNLRPLAARYGLPFDPATAPDAFDATVLKPRRFASAFAAGGVLLLGFACWPAHRLLRRPATG